jgi:hypothetical protein
MATSYRTGHRGNREPAQVCENAAARLAELFPRVTAMRIPIRLVFADGRSEETVIEFGTANEVIFRARAEVGFGEPVQLINDDGSLDAKATVIAVQWAESEQAIAVRFSGQIANWIIKS